MYTEPTTYHDIPFPLYVCLDDGSVIRIERSDKILYHLEAIDIENDEYMFWDALGRDLRILIKKGRVSGFENTKNKITLHQALAGYTNQLEQLGVVVDTSGTPEEIWAILEKAKESLPAPPVPRFFSWLLGRSKK
jgi:hypothetical protein